MACTAAVQPVERLLNFVCVYFLRLVYKTITFLLGLGLHPGHHWGRSRCSSTQPSRLRSFIGEKTICFLPRCMKCRHGLAMRILSVRPSFRLSVRPSVTRVNYDETVERSVQIYTPYERTFCLVLWEEWLVGGDAFYLKFWVNGPPLKQNRLFWTDNRS